MSLESLNTLKPVGDARHGSTIAVHERHLARPTVMEEIVDREIDRLTEPQVRQLAHDGLQLLPHVGGNGFLEVSVAYHERPERHDVRIIDRARKLDPQQLAQPGDQHQR